MWELRPPSAPRATMEAVTTSTILAHWTNCWPRTWEDGIRSLVASLARSTRFRCPWRPPLSSIAVFVVRAYSFWDRRITYPGRNSHWSGVGVDAGFDDVLVIYRSDVGVASASARLSECGERLRQARLKVREAALLRNTLCSVTGMRLFKSTSGSYST